MCWDREGRICNFLDIFLQEFLFLVEVIILNTLIYELSKENYPKGVFRICILYNQRDATYTVFFIIISTQHVSGGFSHIIMSLWNCMCSLGYCHAFLLSTAGVDGWGKFKLNYNLTIITALYMKTDICVFVVISRWILLRMRNVSDKGCTQNHNTHFMSNNFFPKFVPFMR
jgi:hypothetical protein